MDLQFKNWRNFAETFVSVLNLQGQPVSITYSDEEIRSTIKTDTEICEALKLANSGEIVCLSKTNLTCPGGRWHVGFGEKQEGIEKILVEGEKLWATVAIARQSLSNPTSKVSVGLPRLITRRQGSGGGIVPRDHTPTPGKGAPVLKTGV